MKAFFLVIFITLISISSAANVYKIIDLINDSLDENSLQKYKEGLEKVELELEPKSSDWLYKNCNTFLAMDIRQISSIIQVLKHHQIFSSSPCLAALSTKEDQYDFLAKILFDHAIYSSKKLDGTKLAKKIHKVAPVDLFLNDINKEVKIDNTKAPVYFNADLPKGYLALTFDDGPHYKNTETILKTLKDYGVRATFFGVGKNIRKYPEIVRKAYQESHSYGSHSDDHSNLPKLSYYSAIQNIDDGRKSVSDTLNYDFPFFRFPYGSRSDRLQDWVKNQEMATFFWNIDTLDWKYKDPVTLYEYASKQINQHQRGIVLFHDIQGQTATILPHLLEELIAAGYKFVVFIK